MSNSLIENFFKNQRKNLRKLPQQGTSDYERDFSRDALESGKRISKIGKIYWETRKISRRRACYLLRKT